MKDAFHTEIVLIFATISWAGNLYDWKQLDSSIIAPIMHVLQIAAAIIAISLGIRTLTKDAH